MEARMGVVGRARDLKALVEFQAMVLLRAVAAIVRRQRRALAPAKQLELVFPAPPESDREAFARLATYPSGSPERALYRLVSEHGLSRTADMLGLEHATTMMLGWIRAGAVPPRWADAIRGAAQLSRQKSRSGPLPSGAHDPRRDMLAQMTGLSDSRAASILGVSRQTVMRWRREAPKPIGRPKRVS